MIYMTRTYERINMAANKTGTFLRDDKGFYQGLTGEKLPSVSKVKGIMSKDWMKPWVAKIVAEHALENLQEVYRLQRTAGEEKARKFISGVIWKEGKAAMRGTDLHDLADRYANGDPIQNELVADDVNAMLSNYIDFVETMGVEFVATELTVRNNTVGYCGTTDAMVRVPVLGDETFILDAKTGRLYNDYPLQLSAYAHAEEAVFWDEESEKVVRGPLPSVSRSTGLVAQISVEGWKLHRVDDLEEHFEGFKTAHTLYKYKETIEAAGDALYTETHAGSRVNMFDALSVQIKAAGSRVQLNHIYRTAVADGTMTDMHLDVFKAKAAELDAAPAN